MRLIPRLVCDILDRLCAPRAQALSRPLPPTKTSTAGSAISGRRRKSAGVSRAIYDAAFHGVTPDPEVLEKASNQAEFATPLWDYVSKRVSDKRIKGGRDMLVRYRTMLDAIESRYGVDRHILVAIWGMESFYGEVLSNPKIVKGVIRSLATLAYADRRRAKFGRQQLIAALKILQRGDISIEGMTGSWAGAMGHTQFIPTTYEAYAVDFDGDGRRDLWNSPADAIGSAANYLEQGRMGFRHDLGLRGAASAGLRLWARRGRKAAERQRLEEARDRAGSRRRLSAAGG